VSGRRPCELHLKDTRSQVEVVTDNEQILPAGAGVPEHAPHHLAAAVHEGKRFDQRHTAPLKRALGHLIAREELRFTQLQTAMFGQSVDHLKTDIVPGLSVLFPGISQPDDDQRQRLFLRLFGLGRGSGGLFGALGRLDGDCFLGGRLFDLGGLGHHVADHIIGRIEEFHPGNGLDIANMD
jgi:hypothetical protein